jgi:predicted ATPase
MLTKIELTNFKCFQETAVFPLGKITLLTGINGCGKSTLLQSLLLMRQSIAYNENTAQILVNGECISLNSFKDIRNTNVSKDEDIVLKYFFAKNLSVSTNLFEFKGEIVYFLTENLDDDMVGNVSKIELSTRIQQLDGKQNERTNIHTIYQPKPESLNEFNFQYEGFVNEYPEVPGGGNTFIKDLVPTFIFPSRHSEEFWNIFINSHHNNILNSSLSFGHIHYISADRIGPQEYYLKSTLTRFPNVGARGQFTVNLLYKKKDELVHENLCLGQDAKTLATQTEEWMSQILNGAKVEIPSSESNILELLLNTSASKDRFRSANVGYGYHCILPIVVSGLIAKEGEILIVENPEAHLHPRAQSQLAKFLAIVSSCGVQVLVESHSDHILNGLRIAVLDGIIAADDLSVLYFQRNQEQPVVPIPVQPSGAIEVWPEGFFDQMDKDFSRLFGI